MTVTYNAVDWKHMTDRSKELYTDLIEKVLANVKKRIEKSI